MATGNYQSGLNRYRRYVETVRARPLWRATLYLTLSLVLLILLLVTALRPTLVTIAKLVSDIEKQKELNTRLDTKISQIQMAQEAYANSRVAPRLGLLDQGLPAKPQFGMLAEVVEKMAREAGLTIESIAVGQIQFRPVPPGVTNTAGTVEFTIKVEGEYQNIVNFVERLTEWRRLVTVKKVVISIDKSGESGGLTADINGVGGYVYYEEKQN